MDLKAEDENLKAFDEEFDNLRESDGLLDDDEEALTGPNIEIDDMGCCSTKNATSKPSGNFFQN
jgi:hypothetical protein